MYLQAFEKFLNLSNKDRKKILSDLLNNKRNSTLEIHRKYFDGEHWLIDENGRGNTTTSGRKIWGKSKSTSLSDSDAYQRTTTYKEVSFSEGQLQTQNYPKRLTHIYQDYITGGDKNDTNVTYEPNTEEDLELDTDQENIKSINEQLEELWVDVDKFVKTQVARGVINTVMIGKLEYAGGNYSITVCDAIDFYPIYDGSTHVGSLISYEIDDTEALMYGVQTNGKDAIYTEAFFPIGERYHFVRMVNGKIVDEPSPLPDELNFDPHVMVSNIDHPFNKFDDNTLEDTEFFGWIEKNDRLNAALTIEFLTNLFLASPKVSIDFDVLEKMNLSLDDPRIEQGLLAFQYSPFTVDTLPIKVSAGNTIPESFYKGIESIKESLLEDAGVPAFLINGRIPGGLATETIELGMSMLTKKIQQKREQITMLIQGLSLKFLKLQGTEIDKSELVVNFPPVVEISTEDLLNQFKELKNNGTFPHKYVREETLKLLNRSEDIERVIEIENEDLTSLKTRIEEQRGIVRSTQQAREQLAEREKERKQIEEANLRIQALNE